MSERARPLLERLRASHVDSKASKDEVSDSGFGLLDFRFVFSIFPFLVLV